jgi:hypothetical protein
MQLRIHTIARLIPDSVMYTLFSQTIVIKITWCYHRLINMVQAVEGHVNAERVAHMG